MNTFILVLLLIIVYQVGCVFDAVYGDKMMTRFLISYNEKKRKEEEERRLYPHMFEGRAYTGYNYDWFNPHYEYFQYLKWTSIIKALLASLVLLVTLIVKYWPF